MNPPVADITELAHQASRPIHEAISDFRFDAQLEETGTVIQVADGIAFVEGLPGVQSEELVRFAGNVHGLVMNLEPERIGVVLLDEGAGVHAGQSVRRTGHVAEVPVGENLLGRAVDALGRPRDDAGPIDATQRLPAERTAPPIMDRAPVQTPLQTGLKVIDALIPIGRGQRELILGDRQTGKTAIAIDTILNQADTGVLCIYCAVGKRTSAVARIIAQLKQHDAFKRCIVVVADADDPPGQRFLAPYAAMSIGEHFRSAGRDALVVFDDLTRHARAYREISLLLRRPPGREAYPGDIFYIHSRLLERSARVRDKRGGGTLTALPIVETQAENISAYIPTNLVSITDGQIYLSPKLFRKGVLPAVDVGKSVSRVGGKTQLPAYRAVAGDLRLAYSQFTELEAFARFGTRLDEETRATLRRGRRVRAILRQAEAQPLPVPQQIAVLLAVNEGVLDDVPLDKVPNAEEAVRAAVMEEAGATAERILAGEDFTDEDRRQLIDLARRETEQWQDKESDDGDD